MKTRKSTPKYEVIHCTGTVVLSGVSKTEATRIAREMSRGRPGSIVTRPMKSARTSTDGAQR